MGYNGLLMVSLSRSARKKSENDLERVEARLNLVECSRCAAQSNAVFAAIGRFFVIAKERKNENCVKLLFVL